MVTFAPPPLDSVDRAAPHCEIERVWLDGCAPAPAAQYLSKCCCAPIAARSRHDRAVEIPQRDGSLSVMVSDGTLLAHGAPRSAPADRAPQVPQLMRALNTTRKNNRLYVRLLASDAGAVVRGSRSRRCLRRSWRVRGRSQRGDFRSASERDPRRRNLRLNMRSSGRAC